jgi:hypothetical protein
VSETTEIFELRKSGSLLGLAACEYLLRRDDEALNELLQGATDIELGFGLAFLAGNFAAYIRCTAADPLAVIDRYRQELLAG